MIDLDKLKQLNESLVDDKQNYKFLKKHYESTLETIILICKKSNEIREIFKNLDATIDIINQMNKRCNINYTHKHLTQTDNRFDNIVKFRTTTLKKALKIINDNKTIKDLINNYQNELMLKIDTRNRNTSKISKQKHSLLLADLWSNASKKLKSENDYETLYGINYNEDILELIVGIRNIDYDKNLDILSLKKNLSNPQIKSHNLKYYPTLMDDFYKTLHTINDKALEIQALISIYNKELYNIKHLIEFYV